MLIMFGEAFELYSQIKNDSSWWGEGRGATWEMMAGGTVVGAYDDTFCTFRRWLSVCCLPDPLSATCGSKHLPATGPLHMLFPPDGTLCPPMCSPSSSQKSLLRLCSLKTDSHTRLLACSLHSTDLSLQRLYMARPFVCLTCYSVRS